MLRILANSKLLYHVKGLRSAVRYVARCAIFHATLLRKRGSA